MHDTNDKKLYFSCFYAFFYCGIVMLTVGSALPDLRTAYSLTDTMSGALLSCYSLGNLASGIISGLMAVYLGQKPAVILLTASICLGFSLLVWVNIPAVLFIACALAGLGRGSLITFSQRTISILTGGTPRTTVMLHAAFALGAITAPLMFSALRVISWKAGLILVAVLGVMAVCIFLSVRGYPEVRASSGGALTFLTERGFMLTAALMFLYLCCEFAVNGWLVTYMTHKNMSMNFSQSMAALLWLVMLAGRLICAWLSKYVAQKKLLLVSALGSAIFFAFMLVSEGSVHIALSVACLGLCMAGISPIIYAASAPYTSKYPMAMGVLFTIGCTGGTLMPAVTGMIAEHAGFDGGMSAILVTFALLVIFAGINYRRKKS